MKRIHLIIVLALLILTVDSCQANPYQIVDIPPPEGVNAPSIIISSPENNSVLSKNQFQLDVTVQTGQSNVSFDRDSFVVCYEGDWIENRTFLYHTHSQDNDNTSVVHSIVTLANIPEGHHRLVVTAFIIGRIVIPAVYPDLGLVKSFTAANTSAVTFTVDTSAPKIANISLENKTYNSPDISFSFDVNEPVIKTIYSLDGNGNVSTANTQVSLKKLTIGMHNVTVFAQDAAGNYGASQTVFFNVTEPFLIIILQVIVFITAFIGLTIGLLFFRRHRKTADSKQ